MTLDEQLYWMADVTGRAADGDDEALLSPSTAALAAALTARLDEPLAEHRSDVVESLALYHSARCAALPLGSAVEDQRLAFAYFAELDGVPAVPGPDVPVAPAPVVDPDKLMRRWYRLTKKADRSGRLEDLDAAVAAARDLARARGDDTDETAQLADCACAALSQYAETLDDLAMAREAVVAGQRAVTHATPHGGHRIDALLSTAQAQFLVYRLSGLHSDLDPVIATSHALVPVCAAANDIEHLRIAHGELGECYRMRAVWTGAPDDIEASLTHHREALAITPDSHPDHAMYVANQITALVARGTETGSVRHLQEALRLGRTMRGSTGDPERDAIATMAMSKVCNALAFEFDDAALFEESLGYVRAAARIRGLEPDRRRTILTQLALAFVEAYGHGLPEETDADGPGFMPAEQRSAVPRRQLSLLDEAVVAATEATRLPPQPDEASAAHAAHASALHRRAVLTGEDDDVRGAIDQGRAAEAQARAGDPLRPLALDVLARALRLRYAANGDPSSVAEAVALWREATALPNTDVEFRLLIATAWAEAALTADLSPREALDACTAGLDALAVLAGRGTVRGDVERRLARWHGIATSAAVAAIRAGQPGRALEVLEYGRTLMWNRLLDDRTELDGLRRLEPDLADEVEMLRTELDAVHTAVAGADAQDAERLAVLGRRWDELVDRVRAAGFTDFMRPPGIDRLLARTWRGPVVTLAATLHGSYALVVRPDGVRVVDLPRLRLRDVVDRASAYMDALYGASPDEAVLRDVHVWMWDVIAEPVLDALGPAATRVWWCPTGVLALLPIHAAAGRTGAVIDRVISSYTASVRSLPVDDGPSVRRVLDEGGRMMFVGMQHTPGQADLAGVAEERAVLLREAGDRVDVLDDSGARCADVVDALARYPVVHFSGHGMQLAHDPSSGGLVLADGVLSVARLATTRSRLGTLAVLSACQTATGGLVNPDEAITLTSALQFGGWRSVVGTLWPVRDRVAKRVTESLYTSVLDLPAVPPAQALHAAVREQRDRAPDRPSTWAPFVHVGV